MRRMFNSGCQHCGSKGHDVPVDRAVYREHCVSNLRAALAHERDRASRVVRVFWRHYDREDDSVTDYIWTRIWAKRIRLKYGGRITRVTVRRVKKVKHG